MFFVETDSMNTGECLGKTKQESIDITSLMVGRQKAVSDSHLCLLELKTTSLDKRLGVANCK